LALEEIKLTLSGHRVSIDDITTDPLERPSFESFLALFSERHQRQDELALLENEQNVRLGKTVKSLAEYFLKNRKVILEEARQEALLHAARALENTYRATGGHYRRFLAPYDMPHMLSPFGSITINRPRDIRRMLHELQGDILFSLQNTTTWWDSGIVLTLAEMRQAVVEIKMPQNLCLNINSSRHHILNLAVNENKESEDVTDTCRFMMALVDWKMARLKGKSPQMHEGRSKSILIPDTINYKPGEYLKMKNGDNVALIAREKVDWRKIDEYPVAQRTRRSIRRAA
jgi:hypothetical protein